MPCGEYHRLSAVPPRASRQLSNADEARITRAASSTRVRSHQLKFVFVRIYFAASAGERLFATAALPIRVRPSACNAFRPATRRRAWRLALRKLVRGCVRTTADGSNCTVIPNVAARQHHSLTPSRQETLVKWAGCSKL
jgi:hypothetical protein